MYRRKGNTWKNKQKFQLEKEEYDKLVDFIPSVFSDAETFKKQTVSLLKNAMLKMKVQKLEEILRNFDSIKYDFSLNKKRKKYQTKI